MMTYINSNAIEAKSIALKHLNDDVLAKFLPSNPFIIPSGGILPSTGESGKIYLIPASIVGDQNVMLEYVWINNAWEKFGEFATNIDLSDYALKSEIPQTNIYTCTIDSDYHTDYNALLEAINRGDQIFIKTSGLTTPYVCIPMYEESTNSRSILCYPHPIATKQNSDIGFGGSVITVNSGGFCGYDSLELIIKNSGDGTRFLSDSGEYKEISIPSFEVPTKISELENDKGYLVKVVLTQAEYDALETKDPNALYVISDANETEDNNFVTEAQLESRGFLTQTDRSELKEYDDFLLGKISDLESKLTAALGRIATLESELENTLKV